MVAVGEGGVVVGLAPDQEAAGRLLRTVSIGAEVLVLQTLAHYPVADNVAQVLKTEDEFAVGSHCRPQDECRNKQP